MSDVHCTGYQLAGNGKPSVGLVVLSFLQPAEIATRFDVVIEIDYGQNTNPNLKGLE